jgi:hypothetical protein
MASENVHTELTDEDAERFFETVFACEPAIPPEDMNEVANLVFSKERVIRSWRLAAFLGSKGGDFYKNMSTEQAEALAAGMGPLQEFSKLAQTMSEMASSMAARATVACIFHGVDPKGHGHLTPT